MLNHVIYSVAFNSMTPSSLEDMLCYSGNDKLYVRTGSFPVQEQARDTSQTHTPTKDGHRALAVTRQLPVALPHRRASLRFVYLQTRTCSSFVLGLLLLRFHPFYVDDPMYDKGPGVRRITCFLPAFGPLQGSRCTRQRQRCEGPFIHFCCVLSFVF